MKKLLTFLAIVSLFLPVVAHATITVPWTATSTDQGYISPAKVNGLSDGASVTNLIDSALTPGNCVQASVAGLLTTIATPCGAGSSTFGYPFPLTGNATSTLTQFNGGLTAYGTSTIGNGGANGLTIKGNATTTGIAYFAGNVGIGVLNPTSALTLVGNIGNDQLILAQNTNANGVTAFVAEDNGGTRFLTFGVNNTTMNLGASYGLPGEGLFRASTAATGLTFSVVTGPTKFINGASGTESLRINSSGNVGISTTSPYALLSVNGIPTNYNNTIFSIASSTSAFATTTAFDVLANGNVGIGTANPTAKLNVVGSSQTVALFNSTNGPRAFFGFSVSNGLNSYIGSSGTGGGVSILGSDAATQTFGVTNAGNVGVSTSTPYAELSVQALPANYNSTIFTISSSTAAFATTTALTVLANGNVGVGTTNPTSSLYVAGATTISQGSATGGLSIGADINATTRSGSIRKFGVISAPNFSNNANIELFSIDSPDPSDNMVYVGGRPGGSNTGATALNFSTNVNTTNTGGIVRLYVGSNGNVGISSTTPNSLLSVQALPAQYNANVFTVASSTATFATSTLFNIDSNGNAIITNNLKIGGITGSTQCLHVDTNGNVTGTGSDCGSGSGGAFQFSADTNYGQVVYSTSTPTLWFKSGLFASSTSYFTGLTIDSTTGTSNTPSFTFQIGSGPVSGLSGFNGSLYLIGSGGNSISWDGTNFLPSSNNQFNLGILTQEWKGIYAQNSTTTQSVYFSALNAGGLAIDSSHKVYSAATSTLATISGTLNLAAQVSGVLPIVNGGTGSTTAPSGQIIYGGGTSYQSVATTTLVAGTNVTFSGGTPVIVGSSPITINASGSGSSFSYLFPNTDTNYGNTANATSSVVGFTGGLLASSTSHFANADFVNATTSSLGTGDYTTLWRSAPDYLDTQNTGTTNPYSEERLLSNLAVVANGAEATRSDVIDCSGQNLFNNINFLDSSYDAYPTAFMAIFADVATGTCQPKPLVFEVRGPGGNVNQSITQVDLPSGTVGFINNTTGTSTVPSTVKVYVASTTANWKFLVDGANGTTAAPSATPVFAIASTTFVGIGTNFPSQKLEIDNGSIYLNSSGTAFNIISRGATTNFNGFQFDTAGTPEWTFGLRNDSTNDFHFFNENLGSDALSINQTTNALTLGTTTAGCLQTTSAGLVFSATCSSGGSGITAITGPTGLTFAGTPTSVGSLATGYSIKEVSSWTVGAAGADFTTIQAALTQCGAVGGGSIYLVDPSYSQGTTGLTWRGSNCAIYGRGAGTTTISFTGATTGIKTNTPSNQYTHDEIHNVLFSGDNNASGVAVDWSDMTHGIVDNVQITGFARGLKLNDTQNITFYNSFTNIDMNAISVIGIDASSTNPVNANYFNNIFIGSTANNVISFQMDNGNGNTLNNINAEPGSITGTVGLKLFDNKLSTNNGVFNNTFSNWYIEANATGISVPLTVNPAAGGIQRNTFNNITSEANTTDWSVAPGAAAKNNFQCGYDSNFGNCLTSFAGPLGVSSSTEIGNISATPFAFLPVNASSTVASNEFVVDNNTGGLAYRTDLLLNDSGYLGLGGSAQPSSRLTITDQTGNDAALPTVFITGNTNFAKIKPLLLVQGNNGTDSGTTTQIINIGTGPSFEVDDQANDLTPFVIDPNGNVGIGTSTPFGTLSINAAAQSNPYFSIGSSTASVLSILPSNNPFYGLGTTTPWASMSIVGNGISPIFAVATTTNQGLPNFEIDANGHIVTSGATPLLSACGTGTPTAQGNDTNFRIVTETAASSCTATFIKAYTNAPICIATEETQQNAIVGASSTPTTVVLTFATGLTAKEVAVHCEGYQ